MNNSYPRQTSGISGNESEQFKRSIWWRVYFWLMVIQAVGNISFSVLLTPTQFMDLINWMFILTALNGLYGFVFAKKIMDPIFYRIFTPFLVVWDIFFILWWVPNTTGDYYSLIDSFPLMLLFLFLLPQYIALARYAFSNYSDNVA